MSRVSGGSKLEAGWQAGTTAAAAAAAAGNKAEAGALALVHSPPRAVC